MYRFLIVWIFIFSFSSFSQILYYSDCFKGGVVGDGYTAWYTGGPSTVQLPIPAGSAVKKAFFFSNIYKWQGNYVPAQDKIIEINGQQLVLSEQFDLGNVILQQSNQSYISNVVIDITNHIDSSISTYSINPFTNLPPDELPLFSDFYILIIYENLTFTQTCLDVYFNDKDVDPIVNYFVNIVNSLNILKDIGLSIHSTSICNNDIDRYEVSINGTNIGSIGGQEDNTDVYCAGVVGSFYYQNGELFGIGNDTGDTTVDGLDAIANIQPYLNSQNINISFEYTSNFSPYSNLINQLFLTYTTPCQPFDVTVPNDTTVCYGSQVQLNATGGVSTGSLPAYEWSPATGLSCTTCPNPIFTADSSMFYTVRIRNNDSCSVVRPVKINVRPIPSINAISTVATECGSSTGSLTTVGIAMQDLYVVIENGDTLSATSQNQLNATVSNLGAGNYTVFYTDTNGCVSLDSVVTISSINNTIADFTVTPTSGGAPLTVNVNNGSQNATDFEWFTSTGLSHQGTVPPAYVFDSSGTYQIMLVAWQHDPACADTAYASVWVYDSLIVHIPNVFTANGDGVNDFFSITVNQPVKAKLQIVNRWGNEVFSFDGLLNVGTTNLWDGTSAGKVTDGVYFYTLTVDLMTNDMMTGDKGQLKKEGFVTVVK